jgi:hypothetical protein
MSKKLGVGVALAAVCALSVFLLNCGSSSSRPSGTVYVLTQGSNGLGSNVSSFALDLNSGTLSLINSNASTCPTAATNSNPEPCGIPLDILLDPTGAFAYVLNQGTPCVQSGNTCVPTSANPVPPSIFTYTVNSDGSLSAPSSSGVTWTGADTAVAMTRDAAGQFLYVIDQGVYTTQGNCPLNGSSDASFAGCPSISVFAMQKGSASLTLESGSPFYVSKVPTALSAIAVSSAGASACGSTSQELLFVTGSHDLLPQQVDNTVSLFCVSSSGTLTEQPNSPYAIAAIDPVSVLAVNTIPAGQTGAGGVFVYVGSNGPGGGNVNPFEVCMVADSVCSQQDVSENLMVPLSCPTTSCIVGAGQNPSKMLADPTNNFLYVMSQGSNQVFGFRIGTTSGTLTPLTPANEPTGAQPVAMALHPTVNNTGQFLYTSNAGSSNISGFTLDPASGSMSNPVTVIAPASPSGIAVH